MKDSSSSVDRERVVHYLAHEAPHPETLDGIAAALAVPPSERRRLQRVLRRLVEEGEVYGLRGRRYAAPVRIQLTVGRFKGLRRGLGVVIPDGGGEDILVRAGDGGSALDGDRVAVRQESRGRGDRLQGRVVEVLERSRTTIVGRFHRADDRRTEKQRGRRGEVRPGRHRAAPTRLGWVVPEDPALGRDVIVTAEEAPGPVEPGDVVVVRVEDWGDEHRGPAGVIDAILGRPDTPGVDVLTIIHAHELPVEFPPEVITEAAAQRQRGVRTGDLRERTDLRDILTFTIDPADAKDHDDALSFVPRPDGGADIGVHIADVSHYVHKGSALDGEAAARGTSVYLVDRAIPMLPHALSSDLCSLVPEQDRLTLSVLFRSDETGGIVDARLAETVIRSRHRLSYGTAQAVLDGTRSVDTETDAALRALDRIAVTLRAARSERGSLDFDLPEAWVQLDERGAPVAVERRPRLDSHRLVEDLMLLANETVGRAAMRAGIPFLYRIHEPPDDVRIAQVAELAKALGYRPPPKGSPSPKQIQALLDQAKDRPEGPMFSTLVLRSLKQARYSETDAGHFGLAAKAYTHFTSPIRRYPDLVVHRVVREQLLGERRGRAPDIERLRAIARHSSDRERVAQQAERDSIDLKKVRFMERHVGAILDGTISDVRPFGFFVLLDDHYVEGLVHVSALDDDYYRFVEERFLLTGERLGRRFTLGQRLRVQVAAVDVEKRRVDFVPVQQDAARGKRGRRAPERRRSR
ncbi:MAG: ribonuclease R [Longimicrobiales bacterium]